jgi:four helix bundle protein
VLDHEKLDVYRCSLEFLGIALRLAGRLPRGHGPLVDQLRRAATAIPLNIAEGTGKVSAADRANFYAIARGSAMECGALVDVLRLLGTSDGRELVASKDLLLRIVAMLSKMCR